MIFFSIIAFVLGFSMVALGYIVDSIAGAWVAAAAVALYAFFAGQRMAKREHTLATRIVAGLFALLPVWLFPFFSDREAQLREHLPAMAAVTVALYVGLLLTARRRGRTSARKVR